MAVHKRKDSGSTGARLLMTSCETFDLHDVFDLFN